MLELSKYANEVRSSTQKYVAIDLKNPIKGYEEYLEVDLSTYNKYEKGSRKLSNEVVKKLAEYYNISVSDIVD